MQYREGDHGGQRLHFVDFLFEVLQSCSANFAQFSPSKTGPKWNIRCEVYKTVPDHHGHAVNKLKWLGLLGNWLQSSPVKSNTFLVLPVCTVLIKFLRKHDCIQKASNINLMTVCDATTPDSAEGVEPVFAEVLPYRVSVPSARAHGLGWLWFRVFHHLPNSVWADENLAELAMQVDNMVVHPKSTSTHPPNP